MARRRKRRSLVSRLRAAIEAVEVADVRSGAIACLWLAGAGGLVALWLWGVPRLAAHASGRNSTDRIEIRLDGAPAWVRGDLLEQLRLTAIAQLSGDPLRQSDLVDVRTALLETGWFDAIDQVRRRRPDLVEVEGRFVIPFAVVRQAGVDHLVDPTGRLLPRSYPARGAHERFVAISGSRFQPPHRPGLQWPGADITAALRLIDLLRDRPWSGQVDEIDVSRYMDDESLSLITDRGCRIVWGSAPGEERALEALSDLKLRYLDEHYALLRHIDRGHSGTLDLTHREGVFAR